MTNEQWKQLDELASKRILTFTERVQIQDYIKNTEEVDEHPEWYQGPCNCRLCQSYNDG